MAEILGDVKLSLSAIKKDIGSIPGGPFSNCLYDNRYCFGIAARTGRVRSGLPEFALVTTPQGCREGFTGSFKSILARKEKIEFHRGAARPRIVDKYTNKILGKNKKIAVLVVPSPTTTKGVSAKNRIEFHEIALTNSVELLNALEAEYGWPKSVCYRIEGTTHTKQMTATRTLEMKSYIVEVSKRWFRSPHLISLVSLILRSGKSFAKLSKSQLKSIKIRGGEEALDILKEAYIRDNKGDTNRLKLVGKCLPAIMSQYQKVFGTTAMNRSFFPRLKDPRGSKYDMDLGGLEGLDYLLRINGHNRGVASKTLAEKLTKCKVLTALKN